MSHPQFELPTKRRLTLVKANPRKEHHGDSLVQAITLRVRLETTNEELNRVAPGLQDVLCHRGPALEHQSEAEGIPPTKPNLRVPQIVQPIKIEKKHTGYRMEIDYGLGEEGGSNHILSVCTIDKFEFECKEGGTAYIEWSIGSNKDITPKMVGDLCALEGNEIEASLTAPTVSDGPAIDGSKGHPGIDTAKKLEEQGQQRLDGDDQAPADGGNTDATQEFIKRNTSNTSNT